MQYSHSLKIEIIKKNVIFQHGRSNHWAILETFTECKNFSALFLNKNILLRVLISMVFIFPQKTCRNFAELARRGYYNNTIFHRIIRDFMIQGGDPSKYTDFLTYFEIFSQICQLLNIYCLLANQPKQLVQVKVVHQSMVTHSPMKFIPISSTLALAFSQWPTPDQTQMDHSSLLLWHQHSGSMESIRFSDVSIVECKLSSELVLLKPTKMIDQLKQSKFLNRKLRNSKIFPYSHRTWQFDVIFS